MFYFASIIEGKLNLRILGKNSKSSICLIKSLSGKRYKYHKFAFVQKHSVFRLSNKPSF